MASIIGSAVVLQFSQVNLNICNRKIGTLGIRKAKDFYKERTTDIQKGHAVEINDSHTLNVLVIGKIHQHTQQGFASIFLMLILMIEVQELSRTKAFHYKADDVNPMNRVGF